MNVVNVLVNDGAPKTEREGVGRMELLCSKVIEICKMFFLFKFSVVNCKFVLITKFNIDFFYNLF